jgi:hypothetical protein
MVGYTEKIMQFVVNRKRLFLSIFKAIPTYVVLFLDVSVRSGASIEADITFVVRKKRNHLHTCLEGHPSRFSQ